MAEPIGPSSPTTPADEADDTGSAQELDPSGMAPSSRKRTRNKPTVNCLECVRRKTKCDRQRPTCLACLKRQCQCKYSEAANLLIVNGTRQKRPGKKKAESPTDISEDRQQALSQAHLPAPGHEAIYRSASSSSTSSSPFLLSNIPYSIQNPYDVFGVGNKHPFANYWTASGGLAQVVSALPNKIQADILVQKYFDVVDPVYPMIHRRTFYRDYERFWNLSLEEKAHADPVIPALHYAIYAMATLFMEALPDQELYQGAEFYISAAHQALQISSYLSKHTLRTIQAMVLISYFLMNDNRASDAWTFAGVLVRQAVAMGLHLDPDQVTPRASITEKQQRRKVWQSVLFQDTFLTVLNSLPPNTAYTTVNPESLTDELDDSSDQNHTFNGLYDEFNPMSISSIAPTLTPHPSYELSDRLYIRSMWHLANLVQQTMCIPRAVHKPLADSPTQKIGYINLYQSHFDRFAPSLTTSDPVVVREMAQFEPRKLRQNLFFRSNYWHCMMLLHADENQAAGVPCDIQGALEAARNAIGSFFDFWEHARKDASVWWVFQHRAFVEALTMAELLTLSTNSSNGPPLPPSLTNLCMADIQRMLDLLEHIGSAPEVQRTKTGVLRNAFEKVICPPTI